MSLPFRILVNETLINFHPKITFTVYNNENILGLLNYFEEGEWMYEKFNNYIWDKIAETALSEKEKKKIAREPYTTIKNAAKKLVINDGEIAEILLYGVMRDHFKGLPVVPKIFYKQNDNDQAKGADSVHIVLDNDDFTIWYGEAKFYKDIKDTKFTQIINSISNLLTKDRIKKENSIILGLDTLDDYVKNCETKKKIKSVLDTNESIDKIKPKLNVPILLLHEHEYASLENSDDKVLSYYKERATSYLKKQIESLSDKVHLYEKITFHLILFSVPNKKEIVTSFEERAQFYRGN